MWEAGPVPGYSTFPAAASERRRGLAVEEMGDPRHREGTRFPGRRRQAEHNDVGRPFCGWWLGADLRQMGESPNRIVGPYLREVVVPLLLRAAPNRDAAHAPTNRRMATMPEGAVRGRRVGWCGGAGVAVRPYICAHRTGHGGGCV